MADQKTKPNGGSVTEFIKAVEPKVVRDDCREVMRIMRRVSGNRPVLWGTSLVGYGCYEYEYASGNRGEWPITGFSPRARNISIYIMPGFENYQTLLANLGKHKHAKSCLYINQLSDVDLTVLEKLIGRSVTDMRKRYNFR